MVQRRRDSKGICFSFQLCSGGGCLEPIPLASTFQCYLTSIQGHHAFKDKALGHGRLYFGAPRCCWPSVCRVPAPTFPGTGREPSSVIFFGLGLSFSICQSGKGKAGWRIPTRSAVAFGSYGPGRLHQGRSVGRKNARAHWRRSLDEGTETRRRWTWPFFARISDLLCLSREMREA